MSFNRFSAFGVHLGISAIFAATILCLVFFVWYPSPFANAVGVSSIVLILLGVDVVLGPFLTLIVFKPEKPSLKMDLSIIGGVQILALLYGLWSITLARPAWIVFNADRFDLIQAHELDPRVAGEIKKEYKSVSWFGPRYVAAQLEDVSANTLELTMDSLASGYDVANQPWRYEPLDLQKEKIIGKLKSISELKNYNSETEIQNELSNGEGDSCWLPMMAKINSMVVLMDCDKGSVIRVVDLRPWN